MEDQNSQAIVIDNGSETCKAGIAGEDYPRAIFLNTASYPKAKKIGDKDFYICCEARSSLNAPNLKYPIEHGIVTNWDIMEKIWDHTFYNELRMNSEEHPVLLTLDTFGPKNNKEKAAQIMFETFNVPAFYVQNQAVLSLYASNRTTGLVVNSGAGVTNIVPIYEGYALPHAVKSIYVTGLDLTLSLARLIMGIGYKHASPADIMTAQDIKEKLCYVALDFQEEMNKSSLDIEKGYQMPDGNIIMLGTDRFRVPEASFQPSLLELDGDGIGEATYKSIMNCEDIQGELYRNIVMSGGNTMFTGMAERLNKELEMRVQPSTRIEVIAIPERKYSAWIGGSILASLSSFQQCWVTKAEYEEVGFSIIHQKCI